MNPAQLQTSWVNQSAIYRGTNYSTDREMNILYLDGTRRFSYLKFDIAPSTQCDEGFTLGADRTIIAARLQLYTFNIGGLPACAIGSCWHALERVDAGSWNAGSLTWNNQPCPNTGIYVASCRAGDEPGVLFDHGGGPLTQRFQFIEGPMITDDAKGFYASPMTNQGWRIREACAAVGGPYNKSCGSIIPGFQFRSKNATNPAERPKLVVMFR